MKSTLCLFGGLCLLASSSFAFADDLTLSETVQHEARAGDALLIGIPLVALGMTFLFDEPALAVPSLRYDGASGFDADTLIHLNGHPRHDFMLAMGRTVAATYALKYSVREERPNGEDTHSFPSGHASVTFAAAEFIRKEYGWGWGVPAYLAAGFVGYSRVTSKEHHSWDVATGAAIGILSNHDVGKYLTHFGTLTFGPSFTTPHYLADAPFRDDELATLAPAPSLSLELRF
jgi:hypothetical protein